MPNCCSSYSPIAFLPAPIEYNISNKPLHRNQDETLTQNYRRLGLTSRLNSATGGTEKLRAGDISKTSTTSKLAISNAIPKQFAPSSARVERDPTTGKILRVIHAEDDNPLNDPLNVVEAMDFEGAEDDGEVFEGFEGEETRVGKSGKKGKKSQNEIVRKLEEQASMVAEKKERTQSEREREWIERLVGKWGEDFEKIRRANHHVELVRQLLSVPNFQRLEETLRGGVRVLCSDGEQLQVRALDVAQDREQFAGRAGRHDGDDDVNRVQFE